MRMRLDTPSGQMLLMAVTLGGAVVLAIIMATQRDFFEQYIRERYPAPPVNVMALLQGLENGSMDASRVARLAPLEQSALYDAWMGREPSPAESVVPAAMMTHAPQVTLARLERTLVAGSKEQRFKAVDFARRTRTTPVVEVLQRARSHVARMRWHDVLEKMDHVVHPSVKPPA